MLKRAVHGTLRRAGYALYRADHFDIRNPVATLGYDDEAAARAAMGRVRDRTMVSYAALMSLWDQVRHCETRGLPGAFVECGVWKGGVGGFMALGNMAHAETRRPIHLFDAFDDICEPDPELDGQRALDEVAAWAGKDAGELTGALKPLTGIYDHMGGPGEAGAVHRFVAQELGYGDDNVHIHKGWFQDTLPGSDTGDIAILRLDGDWYASTKTCLENLYDRVVPGGFVVIDDYGTYDGCRRAVDEFLAERGETIYMNFISEDGRYWVKP